MYRSYVLLIMRGCILISHGMQWLGSWPAWRLVLFSERMAHANQSGRIRLTYSALNFSHDFRILAYMHDGS